MNGEQWWYDGSAQRGAQWTYSDLAIETVLTLKEVFHLPNRAPEGLARSLMGLFGVELDVSDHSTLWRRGQTVRVRLPRQATGPLPVVLDSSGLKVYGEGEWQERQHGSAKRRTWRKVHLAVDAEPREIHAALLSEASVHEAEAAPVLVAQLHRALASVTADGAYDRQTVYQAVVACAPSATIVIPPRRDAKIQQQGNCHAPPRVRDVNRRYIRQHGRAQWKQTHGYHRRSLAETAMFRLKIIFGPHLSARRLDAQATQVGIRCRALNCMAHLGLPQSYPVT